MARIWNSRKGAKTIKARAGFRNPGSEAAIQGDLSQPRQRARVGLVVWSKWFDWRRALTIVQPETRIRPGDIQHKRTARRRPIATLAMLLCRRIARRM